MKTPSELGMDEDKPEAANRFCPRRFIAVYPNNINMLRRLRVRVGSDLEEEESRGGRLVAETCTVYLILSEVSVCIRAGRLNLLVDSCFDRRVIYLVCVSSINVQLVLLSTILA
jgi:hypothetical protein